MSYRTLLWISLFAIAFAFVEASVVVYLRSLYYPEGFSLPLRPMSGLHLSVEIAREASTIIMLVFVGVLAGKSRWQKFGFFVVAFGVWDIFYYVWLKLLLNWPTSLFEWDVLFLIPLPWIGPVVAPVAISVILVVAGLLIIRKVELDQSFGPPISSWLLGIGGTVVLLVSFMEDYAATLYGEVPKPYYYEFLILGLALYLLSLRLAGLFDIAE